MTLQNESTTVTHFSSSFTVMPLRYSDMWLKIASQYFEVYCVGWFVRPVWSEVKLTHTVMQLPGSMLTAAAWLSVRWMTQLPPLPPASLSSASQLLSRHRRLEWSWWLSDQCCLGVSCLNTVTGGELQPFPCPDFSRILLWLPKCSNQCHCLSVLLWI